MSITRRDFVKCSAVLGGATLLCSQFSQAFAYLEGQESRLEAGQYAYELAEAENIIYSVCLQCHQACPIKGKILDGVLVKIDGSPYGTQTMLRHIDMKVKLQEAALIDGRICVKGQAGVQTLYDPYRIRQVLKRVGPRGSNQWKVIPFNQAIDGRHLHSTLVAPGGGIVTYADKQFLPGGALTTVGYFSQQIYKPELAQLQNLHMEIISPVYVANKSLFL